MEDRKARKKKLSAVYYFPLRQHKLDSFNVLFCSSGLRSQISVAAGANPIKVFLSVVYSTLKTGLHYPVKILA